MISALGVRHLYIGDDRAAATYILAAARGAHRREESTRC